MDLGWGHIVRTVPEKIPAGGQGALPTGSHPSSSFGCGCCSRRSYRLSPHEPETRACQELSGHHNIDRTAWRKHPMSSELFAPPPSPRHRRSLKLIESLEHRRLLASPLVITKG